MTAGRAPQSVLWDFLRGALCTRALGIAGDLRIADALADGPRSAQELASETNADADALHRVLRALASDGVFEEVEPGVFQNTEASELLRSPARDFAHLFGEPFYHAAGALDVSAQDAAFSRVFGTDFWSWLAEHPEERAVFDRAMEDGKEGRVERLAELEWRDGETVVDVGGGNGSLLVELLALRPGLRGVVFDLPETERDDDALRARGIEFVEGSFFERVPEGDVYVLGTVLHDWDDDSAAAILGTIRSCAPPGARILIVDAVVAPGNDPQGSKWLDLLMLALFRGRERTEPEWRALIDGAGLRLESIRDGLIEASCP